MTVNATDWLAAVCIAFVFLTPTQVHAKEKQSTSKTVVLSLLSGRLSAVLPAGAKDIPRGHSISAADTSKEEETRIIVADGKERFAILCQELFEKAGPDFGHAARLFAKQFPAEYGHITMTNAVYRNRSLSGICYLPEKDNPKAADIFIKELIVKNSDGFVEILRFVVNREGAKHLSAYRQSVERIIASLEPGPRRLKSKATTVSMGIDTERKLWLDLPADYLLTTQQGPDFVVYHIHKVVLFGQSAGKMGLYVGQYPQQVEKGEEIAGTLLGTPVHWQHIPSQAKDTNVRQEVTLASPEPPPLNLHIFINAVSEKECQQMQSIAETLRPTESVEVKK